MSSVSVLQFPGARWNRVSFLIPAIDREDSPERERQKERERERERGGRGEREQLHGTANGN